MRTVWVVLLGAALVAPACEPPEAPRDPVTATSAPEQTPVAADPTSSPSPAAPAETSTPAADAAEPQGWVTVRGERFDRVWTGHLQDGEKLSGVVRWKVPIEGIVIGRPLVSQSGMTYVTTTEPAMLHTVSPDGDVASAELSGRIAPLAVRGDVLVLSAPGITVAVDTAASERLWSVPYGVVAGYEERVAVSPGVVYLADSNVVAAVALDVGAVLWTAESNSSSFGSELAGVCVTDDVVCVARGDKMVGLDSATGEELWELSSSDLIDTTVEGQDFGAPTAVLGEIVASGEDGGLVGLDAKNGSLTWTSQGSAPYGSAASLFTFVQTDRTVVARSGESEFWRSTLAGLTLSSAPAVTNHHVVTMSGVASDRHEYASDTVVEAFDLVSGEAAGSVFLEGEGAHPGLAPGPDFMVAVTRIAATAQEVPNHWLVAFS